MSEQAAESAMPTGGLPRRRRGGLFRKYATLLLTLVGGGLLLSGLIEMYFSYQENKRALVKVQREKARSAALVIGQFIGRIESQIVWTNHSSFLSGTAAIEQRHIDYLRLLRQEPAVTDIRLLDPTGKEQLKVSRFDLDLVGSLKDYSRDPRFHQARSKKRYIGSVYFRQETEPFLTLSVAEPGTSAGVTTAEVSLKFIWDKISQINVDQAGQVYVIDTGGVLIAHTDISLVLRKTDLSALSQVQFAIGNSPSVDRRNEAAIAIDLEGRQVLTAHAPIEGLGWLVFVELPLSEAFAPLYDSVLRTVGLIIAGLAIALLASLVLARKMVGPIKILQAGAMRIGRGDFSSRVEVSTGDELEVLSHEINQMAADLQESQLKTERIGRLKRFLSPQIAEAIDSTGDEQFLVSHRRDVTIVFCDLRGFTAFSESSEPEEVMRVLGEYHEALGDLIFRFEGTLERFVGDGLMVLFNDPLPCPESAVQAIRMAAAMRESVRVLREDWQRQGYDLDFGIGIAKGFTTLGKIGFEGRFDYAAIGNVPNLAARICDVAQGDQILISQRVYSAAKDIVEVDPIGDLTFKGIQRPNSVYNVLGVK
jgi:class 3 adenylate cyclase